MNKRRDESEVRVLREIEKDLREIKRELSHKPVTLWIHLEGKHMAAITKNVGETVNGIPFEKDVNGNAVTVDPANISYTQDVQTSGVFLQNADGSFGLTGTAPGVVTMVAKDAKYNLTSPNIVITFLAVNLPPVELDVNLS